MYNSSFTQTNEKICMICFKCLIFSNLFLIFEPPAPLTLGGLAWPEEGVKVKMSRAFSSYLPHGLLHGLYVVWLHPLMSPLKLSSERQWMESIPRVVGIKEKKWECNKVLPH